MLKYVWLSLLVLAATNHVLFDGDLHRYSGLAAALFLSIHLWRGRRWLSALRRGCYDTYRVLLTATNVLLILLFATVFISGLLLWTPWLRGIWRIYAMELHQFAAYASFLLMGLHIGLNWRSLARYFYGCVPFAAVWQTLIVGYAAYAFMTQQMISRLMAEHLLAPNGGVIRFSFDLLMIFAGMVTMGHGLYCACRKNDADKD